MTAQTRATLKGYFQRGNRPTQSQYGDLIDSFSLISTSAEFVQKSGDTMTGLLILSGDPAVSAGAATKQYVDSAINTVSAAAATKAPLAGATFTGKVITTAAAAGNAGFNLPHGAAPSSPVNGDIWTTTSGLYTRINSATYEMQKREILTLGGSAGTGIVGTGLCISTTEARIWIPFGFRLSTAPTGISVANATNFSIYNNSGGGLATALTSLTFVSSSQDGVLLLATIGSASLTVGQATMLICANTNAVITLTGASI